MDRPIHKIENARINYTKLGVQCSERDVLSFIIGLDYGGCGQGYGLLALSTYGEKKARKIPTILASSLLLGIDEIFGCDWEELIGLSCRSYHTYGNIKAIGHYIEDKWLWFDKERAEFTVTPFNQIKG